MTARLFLLALALLCGACDERPEMFEAGMNFDLESVEPFLNQLDSQLQLGLPVAELVTFTRSTAVEDERTKTVSVRFKGVATKLEYRVFMDDIDAPDLYFFTPSADLAAAINARLQKFDANN